MKGWTSVLVVAAALLVLAPLAGAQDDRASASVEPSTAPPGGDLALVFRLDSPDLAEVVVLEEVTCTVDFPDDRERSPCERTGGLAEVHATGSGAREYVFDYQAPILEGSYDVEFEADSTARVLPATYTATTTFVVDASAVTPADDPDDPDGPDDGDADPAGDTDDPPTDGDDPDQAGDDGGGLHALDPDDDASRMAVSTTLATGVLAVTLVANRFPIGGG